MKRTPNKNTLVYKTFGKSVRELTPEERREYNALRNRQYRARKKNEFHTITEQKTLVYKIFGKSTKDLTPEEKKKYDAIRQQKVRDKKKGLSTKQNR